MRKALLLVILLGAFAASCKGPKPLGGEEFGEPIEGPLEHDGFE